MILLKIQKTGSINNLIQLILEFGRQSGVSVVEQYETAKAPELLLTIRTQHALITLGMPEHCQLVADAPPEGYVFSFALIITSV